MDWFDLHAFITVAREKSITKAAQLLHVSQPSLTARLKKLEQELGTELLERNWKGIQLNRQGSLFLARAIKIKQEINDSIAYLQKLNPFYEAASPSSHQRLQAKNLKIGVSRPLGPSFIIPILMELSQAYPQLKCDVISEHSAYILDLVAVGVIDIGIVPYTETSSDLVIVPIFNDEAVLLGPKHPSHAVSHVMEDADLLLQKPFILYYSNSPLRTISDLILIELLGEMPADIREVNDLGVLLGMVENGLGYTVLPISYIVQPESCPAFPFQTRRLGPRFPIRTIHMVYSASGHSDLAIPDIASTISSPYKKSLSTKPSG